MMAKQVLTVQALLRAGFQTVGCWELSDVRKLMCNVSLPAKSGVYAFALNDVVQYVGLASTSLRQRFGHYRNPGPTQSTNIRLNDIIKGHIDQGFVVQILIAHPPSFEWNGLKVKGDQGLESGLIEDFDIPWNVNGSAKARKLVPQASRAGSRNPEQIVDLIRRRPGLTELELAKALYGPSAVQQDVNQTCRLLLKRKLVARFGAGGQGDPFVYRIAK